MNYKALLLAIVSAVSVPTAFAQTDAMLSQYYEVPSYYNPSAIGNTDFIRIRGGARLQWVGIDNAPVDIAAVADMPFKIGSKRLGVGIKLAQNSEGLYKSLDLGAQIAYKWRKWGGLWSAGLQIGLYDQGFKGSEVYIPDNDDYHEGTDDAIPTTDIHGSALDLGAGIWYEHPRFYAGLSCTHLTSPSITMNAESASGGSETSSEKKYEFQAKRTLYFTAGCNIQIKNTLFELVPSV
ncbi:MAG: PorP/SprF family type IX secretion system membrane protein, partial [Muribaculaceae bacterium]|nr:PorP/SprF family type IX secretion system membrane protein [Muribaculaceae bacterium]